MSQNLFCPFGNDIRECLEGRCELWDDEREQCSINTGMYKLAEITEALDDISGNLEELVRCIKLNWT